MDLIDGGLIMDPRDPAQTLSTPRIKKYTTDPQPADGGIGKTFIFAVGASFDLHIARDGDRNQQGSVKHETLFHNADVLAAGEIHIQNGVVAAINDHSGSYKTAGELEINPEFATAVLRALQKSGIHVDEALYDELSELTKD